MKIIVDAFGGDNAPGAVVKGAAKAAADFSVDVILTGNEDTIKKYADENNISLNGIEIVHAPTVIEIEDDTAMVLKEKSNCSMAVGLKLLAEGKGDAFLSAGSTGALVMGATFIAKRLKGIKRAALSPIMPSAKRWFMLTDVGANVDCRPEMLVQFGIMGSCYMQKVMGIEAPKVGLLNIGTEDNKGRELDIEAYKLFKNAPINFCGNIEAREMPFGECDVVVTDGFTGNVALKLYEGMGSFFGRTLRDMFGGFCGKLGALHVMPKIKAFKSKMNVSEVGGAMLMGISKPVIKAHGNSDETAFYYAIKQAKDCVEGNFIKEIAKALQGGVNS